MDLISNSITKIRNAQNNRHEKVVIRDNKIMAAICDILKKGGYIVGHKEANDGPKTFREVILKYDEKGDGVISEFTRVSKTSRRVYSKASEIPRIANGYATVIMTTAKGVITGKDAKETNIGGEVLCYVL